MKLKKVDVITLNCCPKCQSEKISLRYTNGVSRLLKTPYFYATVKCLKCKYFLEASNPEKVIRQFGGEYK